MKKLLLLFMLTFLAVPILFIKQTYALPLANTTYDYYTAPSYNQMTPDALNYPNPISYYQDYAVYSTLSGTLSSWYEDETHFGGNLVYQYYVDYNLYSFIQIQLIDDQDAIYETYEEYSGSWGAGDTTTVNPDYLSFVFFKTYGSEKIFLTSYVYPYNALTMHNIPFTIELNLQFDTMIVLLTYEQDYDNVTYRMNGANITLSGTPADYNEMFNLGLFARGDYYETGYNAGYNVGYTTGENIGLADGFDTGYTQGQDDMFYNGSFAYDYILANSSDYLTGYGVGQSTNVNAGMTLFMVGFEKWIVPAIVLVLLLGGFITIYARKNKDRD